MRDARTSILVFGFYLVGLGLILVVVPNALLSVFGMPAVTDVWIRVVGMLVTFLGTYYVAAAREGITAFYKWTVYSRSAVIVFFTVFVLLGLVKPVLVLFGVVDLVGAMWTRAGLRAASSSS
jgi:hypothetical protein